MEKQWFNVKEAAEYTSEDPQTISKALRRTTYVEGERPPLRGSKMTTSNRWKIRREDLDAWMEAQLL